MNIEEESTNKSQLILYHILTDCETQWLSTFYAWDRLLTLKPFIDILSTTMNVRNVNYKTKKDGKCLEKINLASKEWSIIEDIMPILGQFAEAIEKLEGSKYSTVSYMYPAIQKIKSNLSPFSNPTDDNENPDELDDAFDKRQIEDDLHRALNYYYDDLKLDGLVASLLDP
ncbi:3706_t:CDS:2, partial [Racocetra fulgida]